LIGVNDPNFRCRKFHLTENESDFINFVECYVSNKEILINQ